MKLRVRGAKLALRCLQVAVTHMHKRDRYGEVEGARQAIDGLHGQTLPSTQHPCEKSARKRNAKRKRVRVY
jgi:hypothetical protein